MQLYYIFTILGLQPIYRDTPRWLVPTIDPWLTRIVWNNVYSMYSNRLLKTLVSLIDEENSK
jgi:hypothetical protein